MDRIKRTCALATIACALLSSAATADDPAWTEGVSRQAGVTGRVHAIVEGDGVVYVGGEFETAGTLPIPFVAAFDGVVWSPVGDLAAGLDAPVHSLLYQDGVLYAGGEFLLSQGVQASRVARWDGAQWQPIGSLAAGNAVTALTFHDDGLGPKLCAAVRLDLPGSEYESYVLQVNHSGQWEPLGGTLVDPVSINGEVHDLEPARDGSGVLYAAGRFDQVGDSTIRSLAAWNGQAWEAVGGEGLWLWSYDDGSGDWEIRPGTVHDLVYAWFTGGEKALYAVGAFEYAGDQEIADIVVWKDDAWQTPPLLDHVESFGGAATWNGDLLVGVRCERGYDDELSLVMRLDDGQQWVPESQDEFRAMPNSAICKTHLAGADRLLYGGEWVWGPYGYYMDIRQWTHGRWFGLGGDAASLHRTAQVDALAVYGEGADRALYVGGTLHRSDGLHPSYRGIVRWDGQSYSYPQNATVSDVNDMIIHDDGGGERLFAALTSDLWTPNGFVARHVAAWDGSHWYGIGDPGGGPFGAYDLEVFDAGDGTDLYVGGDALFRAWDGDQWYYPGFGVDGSVWSMAAGELDGAPVLFVGGEFNRAGYVFTNNIAAWDGQEWHEVGGGLPGTVRALGWHNNKLFAAGEFDDPVLLWDGAAWHPFTVLDSDDVVHRMRVLGNRLYMMGDLTFKDGRQGVLVYAGFTNGIDGCPNDVYDIAFYDDGSSEPAFYVGGDFSEAGGVPSWKIARYGYPLPPRLPADFNNDGAVNQRDLGLLLAAFGAEPGHPFFDVRTDLNRDFQINQPDLAELLGVYERGR